MKSLGELLPIDPLDAPLFGEACRLSDVGLLAGRPDLLARYELRRAVRLVDSGQEHQARELLVANQALPAQFSEIVEGRIRERKKYLERQKVASERVAAYSLARQRNGLAPFAGRRVVYEATFDHFGTKSAFKGPALTTLLFTKVRLKDGNKDVADHLWFNATNEFQSACLEPGDTVEFTATATKYERGYFGHRSGVEAGWGDDWKLSRPTNVSVLRRKE